jgi:nitroimidazol reductase NimA-like FMN-containing flavoprotein (pyridoxamine 5'-phosphate oxidase superfamily)
MSKSNEDLSGETLMLEEMKAFAKEKNSCVLATIVDSKPYCSLMAYATNRACTKIYMVTHRQTQKFQNLVANPAVSLLIDTRDTSPRSEARAMTVEGHPEAEVFQIRIKSFLLLDGLTQASFEDLSDSVS